MNDFISADGDEVFSEKKKPVKKKPVREPNVIDADETKLLPNGVIKSVEEYYSKRHKKILKRTVYFFGKEQYKTESEAQKAAFNYMSTCQEQDESISFEGEDS